MSMRALLTAFSLLLATPVAFAAVADLSIQASGTRGSFLPPGTQDTITITLRNAGPEATGGIIVLSSFYNRAPIKDIFLIRRTGPTACPISFDTFTTPNGAVFEVAGMELPSLAVGASFTCEFGIEAVGQGVSAYTLSLQASIPKDTDPNPANNIVSLPYSFFAATAIPSLNGWGILVLMCLLCVLTKPRYLR